MPTACFPIFCSRPSLSSALEARVFGQLLAVCPFSLQAKQVVSAVRSSRRLNRRFSEAALRPSASVKAGKMEDLSRLLARCYFKQGQWQVALHKDWDTVRPVIWDVMFQYRSKCHRGLSRRFCMRTGWQLTTIRSGTKPGTHGLSPTSRSWVTWSRTQKTERTYLRTNLQYTSCKLWKVSIGCPFRFYPPDSRAGFFRSIALQRKTNALQDTLRLLTLWFKYGAHDDVSHAMASGFTDVEIDTWLEVIPQVSLLSDFLTTCSLPSRRSLPAFKHRMPISGATSTTS